jgi:hypothetical protein
MADGLLSRDLKKAHVHILHEILGLMGVLEAAQQIAVQGRLVLLEGRARKLGIGPVGPTGGLFGLDIFRHGYSHIMRLFERVIFWINPEKPCSRRPMFHDKT